MATSAKHHQPKSNAASPSALSTGDTNAKPSGRPPLSSYVQQNDDAPELAFSTQRIEENYPFFGTLMKRENGLFKRKEVIPKSEPKDIEYVKGRYGGGAYQVRQKTDQAEEKINFNISGVKKPSPPQPSGPSAGDKEFVAGLRKELKEELRNDYEAEITRLEQRLQRRNDELDEYAKKVRSLTVELAETDRRSARQVREDTKRLEQKIEELKEENSDLEFDVFELEQEIKYSDAKGGFDLQSMLEDAANNPQLMNLLAPLLGKLLGANEQPAQQGALSGQQGNTSSEQKNKQGNVRTRDAASVQPQQPQQATSQQENKQNNVRTPHAASQQEEPQQGPQEKMQHLINQFSTNIVQNGASAMVNGNPTPEQLKEIVMQNVRQIEGQGIDLEAGIWVGIAKALIKVALGNEVPKEKAAATIEPIMQQFDGAASSLKFIPAGGAAKTLIHRYNIQVNKQEEAFLTDILGVFKQNLTKAS